MKSRKTENGRTSGGTIGNLERKTEPRLLPTGFKARIWLLRTVDLLSLYALGKSQVLGADTCRANLGSITWINDVGSLDLSFITPMGRMIPNYYPVW